MRLTSKKTVRAPLMGNHGPNLATFAALLLIGVTSLITDCHPAIAQFNNGAVIVTVPSTATDDKSPETAKPAPKKRSSSTQTRTRNSSSKTAAARSAPAPSRSSGADRLKIAVLVNDDPITEYEISQRSALLAGSAGLGKQAQANFQNLIKRPETNARLRKILEETVESNRGRSREQILAVFEQRKKTFAVSLQQQAVSMARQSLLPGLRRTATQELIEERLKIQAAAQAKIVITKKQLDDVMQGIAKRNNVTYPAFLQQLKRQGTDPNAMRSRVRAQISWGRLINSKFGRFVDVNQKTIDESVVGGAEADQVSLHLHRLVFKLPAKIDQRIVAERMVEAEQIRAAFKGCKETRSQAVGNKSIEFQDMGFRVAAEVAEPTRSLLLNSRDGEMAPPVTTRDGVALFAVCARRAGNKSFEAREAAERNLRQQGTEIYGRKYLNDLRREAHIEYRAR